MTPGLIGQPAGNGFTTPISAPSIFSGSNQQFGLTGDHLLPSDANGIQKFSPQGIAYLQSQLPNQPNVMQNMIGAIGQGSAGSNMGTGAPPPMSLSQANTAANVAQAGMAGQGMSGMASAAGGAGTGGGLYSLLGSLF